MLPIHGNDNYAVRAGRWGVLGKGCRMQKVSEAPLAKARLFWVEQVHLIQEMQQDPFMAWLQRLK